MTEQEALAQQIIKLLSPQGMRGLKAMLGANTFTSSKDGLSFMFKGSRKVNHVKITLNGMDTFDIIPGRIHGGTYTQGKTVTDVYGDQLAEAFRDLTGLETRVPRIVGS